MFGLRRTVRQQPRDARGRYASATRPRVRICDDCYRAGHRRCSYCTARVTRHDYTR